MAQRRIYDRLPDESVKAHEAFAAYRDMGAGRSIDAVVQKLNKSRTLISRWSGQYNWVERAAEYDDYIDIQARKKVEREAVSRKADMLKRHSQMGRALQSKGLQYLTDSGIDKSSDAISAVKSGIEIERKSEGLPEYLMSIVEAPDDELMRQYAGLLTSLSNPDTADESTEEGDNEV